MIHSIAYYIKNFLNNIKFLIKYDLKTVKYEMYISSYENVLYAINDSKDKNKLPLLNILSFQETVELLLKEPKSFCRFGDGEFELINGKSISFQKYDKRLGTALQSILESENKELYIGINDYFHINSRLNIFNKKFYFDKAPAYRKMLLQYCDRKNLYINAGFNQTYILLEKFNYEEYYEKVKNLFKDRELVIFTGKSVFNNITYDVFEYAKTKEYIWGPSVNAFDEFDNLLSVARKIEKNKTLIFILGPCSKVLINELTKDGYLAWDIGHLAKDYDAYMNNIPKYDKNIIDFFRPD